VTATALAKTPPAAGASSEFPHVLSGVVLDGAAARLAGMLDRALLEEAGWDPATRIPEQIHPIVTDPRCDPTSAGGSSAAPGLAAPPRLRCQARSEPAGAGNEGHSARRLSTRFFPHGCR
jgi:hypothetical protein